MKTCWKCRTTKDLSEFGRAADRYDQKNPKCKACVNADSAEYRLKNPEKRKAICANYRAENADKCRTSQRAWKEKDPVRANAVKTLWVRKNREISNASKAKWRAGNRSVIAEIKAFRSRADGSHTGAEIIGLLALQRDRCAYCKKSLKHGYHKDHITPLKLGGSNRIANIQLLCPTCNLQKGSKDPIVHAQQSGRLL